jgi:hypothetical protein
MNDNDNSNSETLDTIHRILKALGESNDESVQKLLKEVLESE